MADTHEEQLLNSLLRDVGNEDAGLDAAHLEARVLESASIRSKAGAHRPRMWIALPVAAAILFALATTIRPKPDAGEPERSTRAAADATEAEIAEPPAPTVRRESRTDGAAGRRTPREAVASSVVQPVGESPAAESPVAETTVASPPPVQSTSADAPIEFVPLMPITEQELTGSFQIVRVQMPSASLGPLRSPLDQPNDIVEADVLLGEDGRARAIRVNSNTSGSMYPWRPK